MELEDICGGGLVERKYLLALGREYVVVWERAGEVRGDGRWWWTVGWV